MFNRIVILVWVYLHRKVQIMTVTLTVNISDADEKAMLNDLLDIDAWVQSAVAGKINNCKIISNKRLFTSFSSRCS